MKKFFAERQVERTVKVFDNYKKIFRQDGQTAVFYALLLPVLILFLCVVFDLGWLYLNKSRLQNAAEAAAIAGANEFCRTSDTGYNTVMLIYEDDEDYKELYENNAVWPKFNKDLTDKVKTAKDAAQVVAAASVNNNLGVGQDSEASNKDSWTKAEVNMPTADIFGITMGDLKIYYAVELNEDVGHIFKVLDNVVSTKIPVMAVAVLTKERALYGDNEFLPFPVPNWQTQEAVYKLIKGKDSESEEVQKILEEFEKEMGRKYFAGKWRHIQSSDLKIHYTEGNLYKNEDIEVNFNSASLHTTTANGNATYSADEVDALNIDFKQDVAFKFNGDILYDDWDIDYDLAGTEITSVSPYLNVGWGKDQLNFRVHSQINFSQNFLTRTPKGDESDLSKKLAKEYRELFGVAKDTFADPLYIGIESEPMKSELYEVSGQKTLNSVRQLILNINESNMDSADNEAEHEYKYRPLVIIYTGPETNKTTDRRESQPVILNLNADFRGILFMPNSPVVINGNGYKFQGYVIAKEFQRLKTEDDYIKCLREPDKKPIYFNDVEGNTEPGSSDDWVMIQKPDTNDWVKVEKSKLLYFSEYDTVTVSDNSVAQQNEDLSYSFNYTDAKFAIQKTKRESLILYEFDNYDTTTYYRYKPANNEKTPTPAYVRKGLKLGTVENGKFDSNLLKWTSGKVTPSDAEIILYRMDNWMEVKKSESEPYSIKSNGGNILFYKDGWRIVTDEETKKKYIYKVNDLTNLKDYIEITDADGNKAYVKKSEFNNKPVYFQIKYNDEYRYCDKDTYNKDNPHYFIQKNDEESLIIDTHGNVQTATISSNYVYPEAINERNLDARGKSPAFKPETFGLSTSKSDTHYSRCGAIPIRQRYQSLDAFERDGNYCQDMFFTTERSLYVL